MEREKLKSRLGFIMLSAGCAIGIGNIWRFPYVVSQNGGGIFVLFYLLSLFAIASPILVMEYAIGRASKKSISKAYQELEKPGQKWHLHGYAAMLGNYVLMFYYTTVSGWMLNYFYKYLTGSITKHESTAGEMEKVFGNVVSSPVKMTIWMAIIVILGFVICSFGLQKGVEKVTKVMMVALLFLIIVLAVHSFTLNGAAEGLKYYLVPDFSKVNSVGSLLKVITAAINQSFFTLSLGIGSMLIFASYMSKDRSLTTEAFTVAGLDTFVAITAGIIIFPSCFTFGIIPEEPGSALIFETLPPVFNSMAGGRIWGALFFLFMTFASLTTVIAVFENIIACCIDRFNWSRRKACLINFFIILIGSIPCVLGFNVLKDFNPLGEGKVILDLEDFLVSNILLPLGSLIILFFCTRKWGWGFKNFINEANEGKGIKLSNKLYIYFAYILPAVTLFLFVYGILDVFLF